MGTIDWANGRVILDPEAFRAALAELKSCVGDEHVKHLPADLDIAAKATIPHPKRPAAVVYPGTSDEVAAVVKIAGRHQIPLWPCSRGRNWGYGSATPVLENTVVLHLERLDRIIEVNEELAYALLEPGVTYRQLREHLDRHHPGLWCDCTDGTPGGSVIGNALDRGLGTTPYADHFGTLCGLEVVLPSGEFVRTGGGPHDCKTWNTHKWGVGPYLEGLFSQSNFGVVTKAGVWLMPKPDAFASFTFDLARDEDLPRIVDIIRELALKNIITSAVHLINDIVALSVVTQYPPSLLDTHSRLPDEVRAGMRKRYGVAGWSFGGGIQGTRASVRAAKHELRARLNPLGRLVFLDDTAMKGVEMLIRWRKWSLLAGPIDWAVRSFAGKSPEMLEAGPHIHSVLKGIPSDYFVRHAYFKSRKPKPAVSDPDRDDIGLIWFAPIAPMTGAHVEQVMGLCKPLFERHEFDFYAALLVQNPRSMIVLMSIFFLKEDLAEVERATRLYETLSVATIGAGYQTYRMGTNGMDRLRLSEHAVNTLMNTMKNTLDPNNIFAPGKYGISGSQKS